MCVIVVRVIGSLTDGISAVSPLDIGSESVGPWQPGGNLEGGEREEQASDDEAEV